MWYVADLKKTIPILTALVVFQLLGCNESTFTALNNGGGEGGAATPAPVIADVGPTTFLMDNQTQVDLTDPTKTICDPFHDNNTNIPADARAGIAATLKYLTPAMPRYTKASDYQAHGQAVNDVVIFLDEINIPTRKFDLGFINREGETLQTPEGNTLYEYFSLRLEAEVKLGANDRPAKYQFALLSDDGSLLEIDDGAGLQKIVDDDGTHPSKFSCATRPVEMTADSSFPIRVDYYQGPRYHIALLVLWREWSDDPAFKSNDVECGQSGNERYFNYNTVPSTPTARFNNMLARGWKVLSPDNYSLPRAIRSNPCTTVLEPVQTQITGFSPSVSNTHLNTITLTFTSNMPNAVFECELDGSGQIAPCSSPMTYENLSDGSHTFSVWATDSSGRKDETGTSYSWHIDRVSPVVTVLSTVTDQTSITIRWTTSEPSTTKVLWGLTAAVENEVPEDSIFTNTHEVVLSGLTAGKVYFFYVAGTDAAGNTFQSSRFASSTRR